jgi:hypothetical protein
MLAKLFLLTWQPLGGQTAALADAAAANAASCSYVTARSCLRGRKKVQLTHTLTLSLSLSFSLCCFMHQQSGYSARLLRCTCLSALSVRCIKRYSILNGSAAAGRRREYIAWLSTRAAGGAMSVRVYCVYCVGGRSMKEMCTW